MSRPAPYSPTRIRVNPRNKRRRIARHGSTGPAEMKTNVVTIDPVFPDPAAIAGAAEVLRAGGLVAFPTETVYGLGADGLNPAAIARVFHAKGRPPHNPLILHVADTASARELASAWPATADRLAAAFWPGPLTLVVPRAATVPDLVTGGGATIALRRPAHSVAAALIASVGRPIAAPSANRSTRLSPTRAEHVLADLDGRIEMILDAGPTPGGLESTVLDVTTMPPAILRPGLVTATRIESVIGPLRHHDASSEAAPSLPRRSPGLDARHYAPRAALECFDGDAAAHVARLRGGGAKIGWLRFGPIPQMPGLDALSVSMPMTATDYAARLYAVLHDLDRAGVERIVVEWPPATEEWRAVRDRLARASAAPPS